MMRLRLRGLSDWSATAAAAFSTVGVHLAAAVAAAVGSYCITLLLAEVCSARPAQIRGKLLEHMSTNIRIAHQAVLVLLA
jgi:hypothetical protein